MEPQLTGDVLRALIPVDWLAAMDAVPGGLDMDGLASRLNSAPMPILPAKGQWFRALDLTPLHEVRAVILGQDPYPDPAIAEGLAFSVPSEAAIPRSLVRVLAQAAKVASIAEGERSLVPWAGRGVLLLNTALTVRRGRSGSHLGVGWRPVTDAVLRSVARSPGPVVFFAWGRRAQGALTRLGIVEGGPHIVCEAYHPADRQNRFVQTNPFGEADARLAAACAQSIVWSLP